MQETCTRREFVRGVAGGLVGWTVAVAGRAAPDRDPVVDTHLHCFAGKDDARFPYHARAPYRPDKPASPQFLLELMDKAGVDYAVVVHPEPYQDDHRYLEYCLEVGKGRLKGTCLFFADRPESAAKMPALVKKWGLLAVRIHAYAPERLPPFGKPELRNFWKQAADLGIAVQLHLEPRYAPPFEPLIKEFADTRVIIDHLGRPFQGTPEEHGVVVRWSRFPNTVMKLSAIPSEKQYPHRDIAPVIRRLVDAYGPDRLIYGGGFSAEATPASYRATRERTRSFIAHLSEADQAKVLGGTAARLYGLVGKVR
jgi:predicted TIM-barrel fold metal-dependent hydrolase